jgi:hypothetical protein
MAKPALDLFSPVKLPTETVMLPERGVEITLKGMTARELMDFQKSVQKPGKKPGETEVDVESFHFRLIARCLVNENGERYPAEECWPKIAETWPSADYQAAYPVAMRLCGYGSAEGNG